jgi:hypothetical protein
MVKNRSGEESVIATAMSLFVFERLSKNPPSKTKKSPLSAWAERMGRIAFESSVNHEAIRVSATLPLV